MSMFMVFPELTDYSILAVSFLRIVAGAFFLLFGYRLLRTVLEAKEEAHIVRITVGVFATIQLGVGLLLCIGLYTQAAALVGMALTLSSQHLGIGRGKHQSDAHVQFLLFAICFALLFFGAGMFAFDLPI
jgi:Na+-driven multidrug efflux pump